jgi:hypothetical protein
VYAIRDEISEERGTLTFRKNISLRNDILEALQTDGSPARQYIKYALLLFILISLFSGFLKLQNTPQPQPGIPLSHRLALPQTGRHIAVLLFHNEKRCEQCINMEKACLEFIHNQSDAELSLHLINMDRMPYQDLITAHDLFTSSIVLYAFENGKSIRSIIVKYAWENHADRTLLLESIENTFIILGGNSDE